MKSDIIIITIEEALELYRSKSLREIVEHTMSIGMMPFYIEFIKRDELPQHWSEACPSVLNILTA